MSRLSKYKKKLVYLFNSLILNYIFKSLNNDYSINIIIITYKKTILRNNYKYNKQIFFKISEKVLILHNGEVREWLNRAVSKTVEGAIFPRVRIPPSPQLQKSEDRKKKTEKEKEKEVEEKKRRTI